ncbi:MAG: hypothetical protein EPO68_15005 [Planctomycetota bacterium]|nr:MAG: hypothetical protein EPO68_15005 [Planctomycetota bacterium]
MRLPHVPGRAPRRGAALMLSLLVLFVLVAIVFQLNIATGTDARIARNEVVLTQMDLAISSAQLEVFEKLKADSQSSESGAQGGAGGAGGGMPGLPSGGGDSQSMGFGDTSGFGGGGAGGGGNPFGGGGGGGQGGQQGPVDSMQDEWYRPERTSINEIDLRIFIQDEDSKYNVLAILTKDENEARKALDRLTRIFDLCREGTAADIDGARARRMAESVRDHLKQRLDSVLPRPVLLTDADKDGNTLEQGLPLSLREFAVLPGFDESQFRDYRDSEGRVVHSVSSFLTVWTALSTRAEHAQELGNAGDANNGGQGGGNPNVSGNQPGGFAGANAPSGGVDSNVGGSASSGAGAGGQGGASTTTTGIAVNLNTAPGAVLKALFDDREVPPQFWDGVIEFRNLEDEEAIDKAKEEAGGEELEPEVDEWGKEIKPRKYFKSLTDLKEIDGWENLEPQQQAEVQQLVAVQSNVFSIYITARKRTAIEDGSEAFDDPAETRKREERGGYLTRTVRIVVWRRAGGTDGVELVPLETWETIDFAPYEVLDYPDEER